MPEPIVTIVNLDKYRLSDEPTFENAYLTFTFNEDVGAYTVRCMGTSYNTGKNAEFKDKYVQTQASKYTVGSASMETVRTFCSFPANTLLSAEISYFELYQEGNNQINIYGQSVNNIWSNYMQP